MPDLEQPASAVQADDALLVKRVQAGDMQAFDALVLKHQSRVVSLIGRFIRDWSECQDVAQDAFMRAYRALPGFRGDAQFSTWLYRIAVNTAKNHLAFHHRRVPLEGIEFSDAEQFESAYQLRDVETPERLAIQSEMQRAVLKAIESLPPELREAITLREVEGLSYDDIAKRMNCPVGTVRSRIFRARDAMDAALAPWASAAKGAQ
ncbi:RNA polymerase sigma factor RpoE [Lysobacter soyae]|uniref:RNA polymerase sigma factor RpoE n=1 Tax=Lysobacter soyae TaxID=2764185 RepID=A0ABX8WKR7_9GAMM|nr:RNA polymerase sigma factor RpoE [Lysobacter sp. CJ11]QYR52216.1 RNA polymerase sigma factor RpoE [Lysobacter sp. CJ11]